MTTSTNPSPKSVISSSPMTGKRGRGTAQVHLLLHDDDTDNLVSVALQMLAEEGYDEAELLEIGTLTEKPDEEPHAPPIRTRLPVRRRSSSSMIAAACRS